MIRYRKEGDAEFYIIPYDCFEAWIVEKHLSGDIQILYDGTSLADASKAFGEDVSEHY